MMLWYECVRKSFLLKNMAMIIINHNYMCEKWIKSVNLKAFMK